MTRHASESLPDARFPLWARDHGRKHSKQDLHTKDQLERHRFCSTRASGKITQPSASHRLVWVQCGRARDPHIKMINVCDALGWVKVSEALVDQKRCLSNGSFVCNSCLECNRLGSGAQKGNVARATEKLTSSSTFCHSHVILE